MYVLYSINKFAFEILRKDPKRNYKNLRILVFYLKVLINTFLKYKKTDAKIGYITPSKEIYFLKSKVLIKYLDKKIARKYFFLIKNKIVDDLKFSEGFFEQPIYDFEPNTLSSILLLERVYNSHLFPLISLNLELDMDYYTDIHQKVLKGDLNENDSNYLRTILPNGKNVEVYKSWVHGDLWSGNILIINNDIKLVDWDDLSQKSFTYDLFYFYFQEYERDLFIFHDNYEIIKKNIYPYFVSILNQNNIKIKEQDYYNYYNTFILERLIKRYGL